MRCDSCSALLTPTVSWCTQCFAVPADPEQGARPAGWRPEAGDGASYARVVLRSSRVRGGDLSFGPVGRVVLTLAWLLVLVAADYAGLLLCVVIWLMVGPFWLREVWKPTRVL